MVYGPFSAAELLTTGARSLLRPFFTCTEPKEGAQGDGHVGWGLPRTTHTNAHQHRPHALATNPCAPHRLALGKSSPPKPPWQRGMLTLSAVPGVILAAVVVPLALGIAVALVLPAVGLPAASLAGVRGRVQVFGGEKQQCGPQDGPTTLPQPARDPGASFLPLLLPGRA